MKNKIIFVLIGFLFISPSLVNGYNPTNEELRSSIFDYMGTQSQRQQTQDILDDQTRYNNQALNSYYRQLDSLQAENDFKLKQLQAEIEARERAEAWQKEKKVLDLEVELNAQRAELEKQKEAFEQEKTNKNLIKTSPKVENDLSYESFLKSKEQTQKKEEGMFDDIFSTSQNEKTDSVNKPVGRIQQKLLDDAKNKSQAIQNEPTVESNIIPALKKNVFRNIFNKFIGLFK